MTLLHYIHHLFNPHCQECRDEQTENKVCQSCETLKMQLSIANIEKQRLLDALLDKPKVNIEPEKVLDHELLKPKLKLWNVQRQLLEAEDRKKAEILRKKTEDIAKLEKELGVSDAETVERSNAENASSESNGSGEKEASA